MSRKKFAGKEQGFLKRALSFILVFVLMLPVVTESSLPAAAFDHVYFELEAKRIDKNLLPDGNIVYFGTVSATLDESDRYYTVSVYREGDISTSASVDIHTIDMTALYGKDYALVMSGTSEYLSEKNILQTYVEGVLSAEQLLAKGVKLDNSLKQFAENEKTPAKADEKSSLAQLKEEATGEPTRETYPTESVDMIQSMVNGITPEVMNELDHSSSVTVNFKPGEDEKKVSFRIYDDEISEGDESFSLLLTDAVGVEVCEVPSVSVTVKDNEPVLRSEISFTKADYDSKGETVTLELERTGAEYSLVDMRIFTSGKTAKAGVNYEALDTTLAFMPYEMNKKVKLNVAGEGTFTVTLDSFKACTAGETVSAEINISKQNGAPELLTAENMSTFTIHLGETVNGAQKMYTVEYKQGEPTGRIMDTSYDPPIEVGCYYFALPHNNNGIFHYDGSQYSGDTPGFMGTLECKYVDTGTQHTSYGDLAYYSGYTRNTGKVWTHSDLKMPGVYYQYVAGDIESTSNFGGGQKFRINSTSLGKNCYTGGKFGRNLTSVFIKLDNIQSTANNKMFHVSFDSIDDNKNRTPKSYLRVYGVAAMYKRYVISISDPDQMSYLTGNVNNGEPERAMFTPVQMTVKCGAQTAIGAGQTRDIFANPEAESTNLVFTENEVKVNGNSGKFGILKGYKITINPDAGANSVTVTYPDDLLKYLDNKTINKDDGTDYSSSSVEKQKKKILENLTTVPYDRYFIDWIDSLQKEVIGYNLGYYQRLHFKPIYDYETVNVKVVGASGGVDASFVGAYVSQRGDYVFHAGDVLDLRSVSNDMHYRAVGYEYSTDKGTNYYRFPGLSTLCLMNGKTEGYYIRPAVDENDNRIEIKFKNGAEKYFTVNGIEYQGLIDDASLDGKNILSIKKFGNDILEKMNPTVGEIYTIDIVSNADSDEYVYIPVITDNMTGEVYKTKQFHFEARSNKDDNILTVDFEKVLKSDMVRFSVNGSIVTNYPTILPTVKGNVRVPVSDYMVSLPGIQKEIEVNEFDEYGTVIGTKKIQAVSSVSTMTYEDGTFAAGDVGTENHVYGRVGDRITMLVFNGSDKQRVELTLGGTVTNGCASTMLTETAVSYPDGAPYIESINYRYANSSNNDATNENENSIRIFDDSVSFDVIVSNTSNSEIKLVEKLEFGLYEVAGTRLRKFTAFNEDETLQGGKFKLTVEGMNQVFHNGDRLRVRVIERKYDDFGNPYSVAHPEIETGYSFYIENTLIFPKTYELPESEAVNIPIIGAASASVSSGLLSFSKTEWETDEVGRATGYTVSINADVLAFGTQSLGTKEKLDKLKALNQAAKKAQENYNAIGAVEKNLKDSTMATIEALKQTSTPEQSESINNKLRDLEYQKNVFDSYKMDMEDGAGEPLSGFSKVKTMKFNVLIILAFDFIYDPVRAEYVFCSGTAGVTVAANYSQNIYTVLNGVPVFVNFTGSVQGDVFVYYPSHNADNVLTAGDFDKYSGNIHQRLEKTNAVFGLTASIMAQAGAGMCNVLSIRGYVKYGLQFSLPTSDFEKNYGVLLLASGGIGIDLLCLSINFDVGNFKYGFGIYEGKTSVSFLGGNVDIMLSSNDPVHSAQKGNDTQTAIHEYYTGTSDMSDFGYNGFIKATPEEVNRNILLDDAAERTRPKLILFDDGSRMLFFIGNRGTTGTLNDMALFYTVYKNGVWSKPQMVSDDGTMDTNPAVIYRNGKAAVAWVDANKTFNENDTNFDKLNSLGISVAVYENGTFNKEMTLVDDGFFNFAPQLNIVGDKLYCSYMKRDISDVKTEEGLLDLTATYSTMAYVKCDIPTRTVENEEFITVQHPLLTDPLVFDYKSETTKINGKNYMLATYTVDEDCDLNTHSDRELFLSITDIDSDITYYPIPMTNDMLSQSSPALTDIDGTVYLTWLENGGTFNLFDVSNMLEGLLGSDSSVSSVYIQSAENGDKEWYRKTAEELGIDKEYYERTLFEELYNNDISSEKENLQKDESSSVSVADYRLVTNGDDIYIFYTSTDTKEGDDGIELFGARYQRDVSENDDETVDVDDIEIHENWGFGKAVQITDYGKVIDEFDIVMTKDNDIFAVSNHYDHWIDDNGNIQNGKNQLVEIEFSPKGSISVLGDITIPESLVKNTTENIVFTVQNEGLITTTGFDYTVSTVKNGVKNVIASDSLDMHLDASETYEITVPWMIPEDISDMSIEVTVSEHDVDVSNPDTVTKELRCESVLKISDDVIKSENGKYYVYATVKNIGNKDAKASLGKLIRLDGAKDAEVYCEFDIPALASGESFNAVIPFEPSVDDFTSFGYINMKLATYVQDSEHTSKTIRFIPGVPVCAEINGIDGEINLAEGMTFGVNAVAAPWDDLSGNVVFTTDDPLVATVDENGVITANGNGTATLCAYYPRWGIYATAEINVEGDAPTPVYTVTVNDAEHGTVTVDKSECEENGTVTITVTPDFGYKTENVSVSDANGNVVSVTDNKDGTYSFIQPSHNVTVDVLFVVDEEADNPPTFDIIPLTALITVISFASTVLLSKKLKKRY
ncbi:MAG: hypothetical protein IKL21_07830 [Clostridia bacterium]|nr:hypothetical protein [Clostridia bacterium]